MRENRGVMPRFLCILRTMKRACGFVRTNNPVYIYRKEKIRKKLYFWVKK